MVRYNKLILAGLLVMVPALVLPVTAFTRRWSALKARRPSPSALCPIKRPFHLKEPISNRPATVSSCAAMWPRQLKEWSACPT